jgi:hypothetical protein
MSVYTPDVWVIVKFSGNKVPDGELYKVLAGWFGGFAGADSWKLNSGITKIKKKKKVYSVSGYSGSVYECHQDAERTNMMTHGIFQQYSEAYKQNGHDVKMEIVPIETILDKFK